MALDEALDANMPCPRGDPVADGCLRVCAGCEHYCRMHFAEDAAGGTACDEDDCGCDNWRDG